MSKTSNLIMSPQNYKHLLIFKIYDPYNLLLEAKILEADIAMLKKGTAAQVSLIANPGLLYKAAVYEINPYVDENGMVLVKLKMVNSQSSIVNKGSAGSKSPLRGVGGFFFPA